ncbi:MAG: glycoside hydrolase family 10 protein [Verrucomicrobiota bacterium JB025]|nr:family 10 glycosylhydrolase [Verrucomicrobiota bacterium JB025]
MLRVILLLGLMMAGAFGQAYVPVRERPPELGREFRGAWVATVYNIDWPSRKGLAAETQKAEMRRILDKLVELKMNAMVFQVRPECDALYRSAVEPWSGWLTGTQGKSPGYDPLGYAIEQAHARGIEVHAWFNPFRARCNNESPVSRKHVTRTQPGMTRRYGTMTWCDPGDPDARAHALRVILDVVQRYDVDGVHLDDYFYPYPKGGLSFVDGRTPAQRRASIDGFVKGLYEGVKRRKPWVRVGISPFGIWRPGVPAGIEANLDSFEQLAGDSRKWLAKGWVDYLAPQLYWRIEPRKQSFPVLLEWWRKQGSRPVWPGIATSRIESSEDPGRPASEIIHQIDLTRKLGRVSHGHVHWSAKALLENRGGISRSLAKVYTQPVAVPPMPWVSRRVPASPGVGAMAKGGVTQVRWVPDDRTAKVVVRARRGRVWRTDRICPVSAGSVEIPRADAIAVVALDRFGTASEPKVLGLR